MTTHILRDKEWEHPGTVTIEIRKTHPRKIKRVYVFELVQKRLETVRQRLVESGYKTGHFKPPVAEGVESRNRGVKSESGVGPLREFRHSTSLQF